MLRFKNTHKKNKKKKTTNTFAHKYGCVCVCTDMKNCKEIMVSYQKLRNVCCPVNNKIENDLSDQIPTGW